MSHSDPVVIVSAKRTPIGSFGGVFKDIPAHQLGALAIKACLDETGHVLDTAIERVLMGCVLQAGQGQAPARQATLGAALPNHVPATTLNKMCGSGLESVILAHDALLAGSQRVLVAGGMESMSRAPYLLPKERFGARMGHGVVQDHMFLDGLEDAYDKGKLMGYFADQSAKIYGISRSMQDDWAKRSLERAQLSTEKGYFHGEIAPVDLPPLRGESQCVEKDECPQQAKPHKIPELKPAFTPDGSVTAANASSISDGAAALILMRKSEAEKRALPILGTIRAHAGSADAPEWFTRAPVAAIQAALTKAAWPKDSVDLFEINEAFAVVTLLAIQELKLDPERVNVCGGACALGHPIGASGSRILTTLIYALKRLHKKRGIASLCIGGGEALALAVEVTT